MEFVEECHLFIVDEMGTVRRGSELNESLLVAPALASEIENHEVQGRFRVLAYSSTLARKGGCSLALPSHHPTSSCERPLTTHNVYPEPHGLMNTPFFLIRPLRSSTFLASVRRAHPSKRNFMMTTRLEKEARRFLPLGEGANKVVEGVPKLKGIVFDVDGTLW